MLSAVSRHQRIVLGLAVVCTVAAGIGHAAAGPVLAFITAALALSLLAMVVGEATDQMGSRLSPGATGVLQSALGNLPELFVCIFSLRAGLNEVVKSALIGSILANSVLVLGLAILVGGLKNGHQKFSSEPPRMMAVLMLLATAALLVPTLAHEAHTAASVHEASLSSFCAFVLLAVFVCSLTFFLRGSKEVAPEAHDPGAATWVMPFAIGVLAFAGIGAAFVSEWFVAALEPAMKALGRSEAFAGLVVVAIAGSAIENLVGIQLAARNKMDYAISVILNSSLQIALVLIPVLVLLSLWIAPVALTLTLSPMLACALVLSSIVSAFVVFDGESIWLEGVALIGLYVIIAAAFWWG